MKICIWKNVFAKLTQQSIEYMGAWYFLSKFVMQGD